MKKYVLSAVVFIAMLSFCFAQEEKGECKGKGEGKGQIEKRTPPPVIAALDKNGDRVIDEKEIANASEALETLDKNGDGKLTKEEIMPPRDNGKNKEPKEKKDKEEKSEKSNEDKK